MIIAAWSAPVMTATVPLMATVEDPAGTVMEDGTDKLMLSEPTATGVPPVGEGRSRVTVQTGGIEFRTVVGEQTRPFTRGGTARIEIEFPIPAAGKVEASPEAATAPVT